MIYYFSRFCGLISFSWVLNWGWNIEDDLFCKSGALVLIVAWALGCWSLWLLSPYDVSSVSGLVQTSSPVAGSQGGDNEAGRPVKT